MVAVVTARTLGPALTSRVTHAYTLRHRAQPGAIPQKTRRTTSSAVLVVADVVDVVSHAVTVGATAADANVLMLSRAFAATLAQATSEPLSVR